MVGISLIRFSNNIKGGPVREKGRYIMVRIRKSSSKMFCKKHSWSGAGYERLESESFHKMSPFLTDKFGQDFLLSRIGKTVIFRAISHSYEFFQNDGRIKTVSVRPLTGDWLELFSVDNYYGSARQHSSYQETLWFLISGEGTVAISLDFSPEVVLRIYDEKRKCDIIARTIPSLPIVEGVEKIFN